MGYVFSNLMAKPPSKEFEEPSTIPPNELVARRDGNCPGYALKTWVDTLIGRYGPGEACELFMRLDMRVFDEAPVSA